MSIIDDVTIGVVGLPDIVRIRTEENLRMRPEEDDEQIQENEPEEDERDMVV